MSYSRELDDTYQPTEKIDNKSRFHLQDAERYLLSDFGPERVVGANQLVEVKRYWNQDGPRSKRFRDRMRQRA